MSNKKIINEPMKNSCLELPNENEIIEEIINNSLFDDIKGIEEDEELEEENYSENYKFTEEILGNKLSFLIDDEEKEENLKESNNKKKSNSIYRDIIGNLLIDLFDYHNTEISKEKKINLINKIFESKYHIELFCDDNNIKMNFSKYLLTILELKIYGLIEYISNKIKSSNIIFKDVLIIKNSLLLTGKDINKIFEKPFQITKYFDISKIIIVLFISNILSENVDKITLEEFEQIKEIGSIEEKDKFEKYIEECKSCLSITDEEDIKYETNSIDKESEEKNEHIEQNEQNLSLFIEEEKQTNNIQIDSENNIINNNTSNIKNNENNIIINEIIEETNDINNNSNVVNILDINNNEKKVNENNESISKINNENIENNNNIINNEDKQQNYSNIEELIKYINGNDIKKKKKKKRKKKSKVKIIEKEKENKIIEKDIIFENFKAYLINFSNNLEKVKKIKPIISEAFLEKLKLIN